jgi:hypothetical protein
VDKLDDGLWQKSSIGKAKGWVVREDGSFKTRVVDGACIFHNERDFDGPGGYGCALHALAEREGISFVETKPEVCWQLPLRRSYDTVSYEDGEERQVLVLSEYDRRGWGEGGHDFDWYCSGNTDAHIGTEPVYISSRTEIEALIGAEAYQELARICAARERLMLTVLDAGQEDALKALAPHPADPR